MTKERQGKKQIRKGRTIPIRRNRIKTNVLSERIDSLGEAENWDEVIKLVREELKHRHDSHWLLTQLASAYYEKHDYENAYKSITNAVLLKNDCPLTLWYLASIFRVSNKQEDAIIVWEEIINKGVESVAYDECGEGLEWAKSLIADCKYMISKTYKDLGNKKLGKDFKEAYLKDIADGATSIYDPATL